MDFEYFNLKEYYMSNIVFFTYGNFLIFITLI
jgi:hypothetical protein